LAHISEPYPKTHILSSLFTILVILLARCV
jgi:hypothetical protein